MVREGFLEEVTFQLGLAESEGTSQRGFEDRPSAKSLQWERIQCFQGRAGSMAGTMERRVAGEEAGEQGRAEPVGPLGALLAP